MLGDYFARYMYTGTVHVYMIEESELSAIESVAEEAAVHTETFCEHCREEEVDPLGMISGVNTPANKKINELTDTILEREGLDPVCQTEIRDQLIGEFYGYYNSQISEKEVDSPVECWYCFENGYTEIMVSDPGSMILRERERWR